MILYSDILQQRSRLSGFFSSARRKPRIWAEYPYAGNVLNFGSGNVKAANHQEIVNSYKEVYACDTDPASGAEFISIEKITKKFDLIICEHVFEHIKPEVFVDGLKKIFTISLIPIAR